MVGLTLVVTSAAVVALVEETQEANLVIEVAGQAAVISVGGMSADHAATLPPTRQRQSPAFQPQQ
ncbi:hypothetical protein [Hymenobacter radiodurans]|uniref:hypothetical protein n=1 Tax=Hymenobacter radiodurans TaxID=2496028 RepID=UPI0010591BB3|nr:hypothetical protein [Hymenobacter radiodurans]